MPQIFAHFYYFGPTDKYPISGGQNEYSTSSTPCDTSTKWDTVESYTIEEAKILYPEAMGINEDFSHLDDLTVEVYS